MPQLRLATYNIEEGSPQRIDAVYRTLASINADIIALTEADDEQVTGELAERLEMQHVWSPGSGIHHVATLSRFPIGARQTYNTPPLTQAVLQTEICIGEQSLTVFNLHLLPWLLLPYELRRWQAVGHLLALIRQQNIGMHLIVGDFNSVAPGDRALRHNMLPRMRMLMMPQLQIIFRLTLRRLLRAGYVDCYRQLNPGKDGFTWMTTSPALRNDYILAAPQVAPLLRACRVVDDLPGLQQTSDHYPVVADFEWPPS